MFFTARCSVWLSSCMRITIHSDPVTLPLNRTPFFAKSQQRCSFYTSETFHNDVRKTTGVDLQQLLSVLNLSTSPNQNEEIMSLDNSSDESEEEILESSDEDEDSLSSTSSRSSPDPPSSAAVVSGQKRNITSVKETTRYEEEFYESDEDEDRDIAISIKRKKVSILEPSSSSSSLDDGSYNTVSASPPRPPMIRAGTVAATSLKQKSDIFGLGTDSKPMKRRAVVRSSTISGASLRTVTNPQPKPVHVQQSMFATNSATTTNSKVEEPPSRLLRKKQLSPSVTLEIRKGDLTEETSEAIVNAANGRLSHGGGVAGAISRNGGATIQDESDDWIREYGDVLTGNVAYTSAGYLPAKYVIHAVGPIWSSRNASKCENQLRMAVLNSLRCADQLSLSSVSIPAISSGIFGFPKELCAEIMLEEVMKYANEPTTSSLSSSDATSTTAATETPKPTLRTIRLVNFDDLTCNIFCKTFDEQFGTSSPPSPTSSNKKWSLW
eukprot:TRINITY_DN6183_c0_g1_i1.p1 TRINITY_DN6183_c0_g1~~TRINITY_DN6183_c0_g1_i1.p1  ORF type:complete len:495 (-),score=88.43 TRINITY_DN6183_c0_g1_i1:38-1522(-)